MILPGVMLPRVMTIWLQMQSSAWQSPQIPRSQQGVLPGKPLCVDRRGRVARARNGRLQIGGELVDARDHDHALWPVAQRRHAVAAAVDVDQLAVLGEGVRPHQIGVREKRLTLQRGLFLRRRGAVAVDRAVVPRPHRVLQADLLHAEAAAPADGRALRNQRKRDLQRLRAVQCIVCLMVPRLKHPNDPLCGKRVALCNDV